MDKELMLKDLLFATLGFELEYIAHLVCGSNQSIFDSMTVTRLSISLTSN